MNKVFKLIWSQLAGTWIAVSETASARGKRSAGIVLVGGALLPAAVFSQVVANGTVETAAGTITPVGSNPALYASNNGVINSFGPLAIEMPVGNDSFAVQATTGGRILLSDGSYVSTTSFTGLTANGADSKITAINTTVLGTGPFTMGARVANGGALDLTGGSVKAGQSVQLVDGASLAASNVEFVSTGGGTNNIGINASNSAVSLNGGSVTTTGSGSFNYGLYSHDPASAAGSKDTVSATGTTIRTAGQSSTGAMLKAGRMRLDGVTIVTTGAGSEGARVDGINDPAGGRSALTMNGGSVTTLSTQGTSHGLVSLSGAVLNANNVTVKTMGTSSHGALAQVGAQLNLNGGSISTEGDSAYGLFAAISGGQAGAAAQIQAIGSTITTSGAYAHGAVVRSAGDVTLEGSSISTHGAGASALRSSVYDRSGVSTATLRNSTLSSAQAAGIRVVGPQPDRPGATSQLDVALLENSSVTGHTNAIEVANTPDGLATLNLTADASTLQGGATLDAGGTSNVSLRNGSQWTMTAPVAVSQLSLDASTLRYGAEGVSLTTPGPIAVGAGGATIDTNGFDARLDPALSGSGDIRKTGAGTLTLAAANTYAGTTTVAGGSLRAGAVNAFSPASAHVVDTGATLDLAGFDQTLPGLGNSGTVSLMGAAPGTRLTVTGAYVGHGGTLRIGTSLGGNGSASDRLVLDGAGASASGHTQVQVTNMGGLGALTTGDGIEVVSALNGATTTAQTTRDAFALAGGHVDAGAYEYRLHAADADGAGENWYLRSSVAPEPGAAADPTKPRGASKRIEEAASGTATVPSYRAEVPLLAALPAQVRQSDVAMAGNLHQRRGDDTQAPEGEQRQAWGRVISTDLDIRQEGTVAPGSQGRRTGWQAGTDLWKHSEWRTGVYVGQLEGDAQVDGFARGVVNLGAGALDLRSRYLGLYGTYASASGLYVDTVLQAARHDYTASPWGNARVSGKGSSQLASVEAGRAFPLSERWKIEPQLQLVYQRTRIDDLAIPAALVQQQTGGNWLARAGVRLKGDVDTRAGLLQPYARLNVYRSSGGEDVARFIGPAASTDIVTRKGQTSAELAAGATLRLNERVSLYGEAGKLFAVGGAERVKSGLQGSVGLRVQW